MDRFVAMVWDQANSSRQSQVAVWSETLQRQSPKWKLVLDRPGLRVFSYHHRGECPAVTSWRGRDGIIVGVLFERGQERKGRVQSLDARVAERVVTSRGAELIDKYWGNYVALWRNPETQKTAVLRDPCAAVACFMTRQKDVEVLFADVEDVADFPGLAFTIDWTFLKTFLVWQYFGMRHTGLNEIKEVLAGQRMEIAANGEKSFSWAWNGAEIAAKPNFQSFDEAKVELRTTAEACFTAWGKEYKNIVVRLSGGLDSSIVANLMRRVSESKIVGQHWVGEDYDKYELKLARLSAAYAGIELAEPAMPPVTDMRRMLDAPRLTRPVKQLLGSEIDEAMVRFADKLGSDCFMSGEGGDQLFMQRSSGAYALTDYIQLNGIGPALWRTAYETAMLTQRSSWRALHEAIDVAVFHRAWIPFRFLDNERTNKDRLLKEDIVKSIPDSYMSHPWLAQAARLPRGMAMRVSEAISLYDYHARLGFGFLRDAISPLFCQPIAEFALRTPSYVLGKDGLDRALERHAFADLIPEAVFRRTGKGSVGHTLQKQMCQNIAFCRELILDGTLAQQGWLDRSKAEYMLTPDYMATGRGAVFVQTFAVAEAWLKAWHNNSASIAA